MYAIAVIGDILSLVPGVNILSNFITAIALGMAGAGTQHSIYTDNRIAGTLGVIILEAIPGLSMIPAWTVRVYFAKKPSQ